MAVFAYRASDTDRSVLRGTVVADSPRQARDQLRAKGLTVQDVSSVRTGSQLSWWQQYWGAPSSARVVEMIRELATLLGVGIPLLEALETIAKQHTGRFRGNILQLKDRVAAGMSLAEAMREQPRVFDELSLSIVEVGENAGTLETALEQLADYRERAMQLRNRIGSALLYPAIVLLTGIGVSIFLMSFVVPNLLEALVEAGRPLPFSTRLVKSASEFIVHRWWLLLLLVAATIAGASAILHAPNGRGRRLWHRTLLQLPGVGGLVRKQAVVRIAMVISTLLKSGIVFVRAVQIAQRTTPNLVIREALVRCEQAVYAGRDIAEALEETKAFPPMVVQIFAVGQQSGRLEEMLDRLAVDYDRQVAAASQRLATVLEPILIVLLAVVVGFIAFATILPILEAGNVF